MVTLTTVEIITVFSDKSQREALLLSWPKYKCTCCKKGVPATGIWYTRFAKQVEPYFISELKLLCAGCGLTDGYRIWNGFMSRKLLHVDLFATITQPLGDTRSNADRLIEKLLTHPSGQLYLTAWKAVFKPANLSHPIAPAFQTLETIVHKLFPPAAQE